MGNEVKNKVHHAVAEDYEKKPLQVVCFNLGDHEFCVDIMQVQEIIRVDEIMAASNAPDFVEGLVDLPEKAIPIIDLRKRFGIDSKESEENPRIVVVNIDDYTVGMIVDAVYEVLRLEAPELESLSGTDMPNLSEFKAKMITLDDRVLMLLDTSKLLSQNEKKLVSRL